MTKQKHRNISHDTYIMMNKQKHRNTSRDTYIMLTKQKHRNITSNFLPCKRSFLLLSFFVPINGVVICLYLFIYLFSLMFYMFYYLV